MTSAASLTMEMRANFRHLYYDIFWFGIVAGSTAAFLAVYAARIGATSLHIGLLTAGPAVLNIIFSLPAGRIIEGLPLIRTTFVSALCNRTGYWLFALVPWLLPEQYQIWALVGIVILMSIPGTFIAISFYAMFAGVVPAEHRAIVTGRRNALLAISMTGSTLISGLILDTLVYPLNYQVVFLIGAIGGYLSTYHLSRLRQESMETSHRQKRSLSAEAAVEESQKGLQRTLRTARPLVRFDLLRSSFGIFLLAFLAFYTFQYLPLPLFPLIFVNELELTDGMISLGSALFYLVMFLISLQLPRIAGKYGHHRTLVVSALGYGIYPLMIGIARGPNMYYAASLVGGGFWGISSASLINRLMERASEEDRPASMTLHNLTLNIGILIGSIAGPLLGDWIGLQPASIFSGILRFIAGILLGIWG